MLENVGYFIHDISQVFIELILYIPRRIYGHFQYVKKLEKENTELEIAIHNRDLILKRIICTCECNSYGKKEKDSEESKLRKIKELAQTFPQEQS